MTKNIGIIRANYSHKGELAILKGTLNVFRTLGLHVSSFIDPEMGFPKDFLEGASIIQGWPTVFQRNLIGGMGIRKKAYFEAISSFLTLRPKDVDLDLLWYMGAFRFGAVVSRFPFAELLNVLYYKHLFKKKIVLGGVSIAIGKDFLSRIYTNTLYKKMMADMDYVFAKDMRTFNFLRALGFPLDKLSFVCDFAFHMDLDSGKTTRVNEAASVIRECERPVGLALHYHMLKYPKLGFNNKYFWQLLKLVRRLNDEGFSIFIIPISYSQRSLNSLYVDNDLEIYVMLRRILGPRIRVIQTANLEPEEIVQVMKNLDSLISVKRMRAAVLSRLANVPTVHIYFQEKSLMFKDLFGDFPLFSHHDWIARPDINDKILALVKNDSKVNYEDKINTWKRYSLKQIKLGLERLGI